jgi:IPT/TIG domain
MLSFKAKKNLFKAMARIFFFIVLVRLLSYCEEEKSQSRSYPRVKTHAVTNITSSGATFNGEIFSLGTEPIINHGFVWSETDNPTLMNSKILLGAEAVTGAYSAEIFSSLTKDVEYTVKSMVQTAEHVIYGTPVTFKSLGSGAPVITGFEPDSAAWLDTIKISGMNFSYDKQLNLVKLNQTNCNVIAATDSTLFVLVGTDITQIKNLLSVEISGNVSVCIRDTLRLLPPVINGFYPVKAFWSDTLQIRGRHLRSFGLRPENSIKIGTFTCEKVGQISDSSISVKIPDETALLKTELSMKINGFNLVAGQQFELLPPHFTFSPANGTWGSTVTLDGKFNSVTARNSFYFNNSKAIVVSSSQNTVKIKVPYSLSDVKSNIVYKVDPFTIVASDTFRLSPPVINTFTPLSGPTGTAVTIKGKYFDVMSTVVKFGNTSATVSSLNDSVIVAIVPSGIGGDLKISVVGRSQSVISSDYFGVTNPKITDVSPLSGTFNDEITITGEDFESPAGAISVSFGEIPAVIKSISATSIVVNVPASIDSIPRNIKVTVGPENVFSAQEFVLSPHQISLVSPSEIAPGADLTISGTGFNPESSGNVVLWDIYPLAIKSVSQTEIIATLPQALPRGNFGIKVITGGYSRSSSQKFSVDSRWLRLNAPEIPCTFPYSYYGGISTYGKSLKNFGYIYSEATTGTYKFDPSDNTFTRLSTSPYDGSVHVQMGEVVCKDTFYLISGLYNGNRMWGLNDETETWNGLALPQSVNMAGVAFSLNNKIYSGLSYRSVSVSFFECDPANNYNWTKKSDFPVEPPIYYSTYFSSGNKGYVVFSDNSVWQYDADLDQWTRKAGFPGPGRILAFSFVIADKAYLGSGKSMSDNSELNDLWEYDPGADSWTFKTYMPLKRHSAVAFSIGSKAYIGFGLKNADGYPINLYDFYEYDPNYPAK